MGKILWNSVLVGVFICIGVTNTVAYSKYGRKCADIGCPSNQVCVMAEDPCNRGSTACGLYPTCQNKALGSGGPESPGGSSTQNGHRIDSNYNQDNPFNNANAPPPEHHDTGFNQHPSSSGLGYPSYPGNTGHYSSNSGASGSNLGYPPYPTQNRMPQASNPGYYPQNNNGQPGYPNYQQPGLHNQYPGHQYNNHNYNDRKHYRGSAELSSPRITTVGLITLTLFLITKHLS